MMPATMAKVSPGRVEPVIGSSAIPCEQGTERLGKRGRGEHAKWLESGTRQVVVVFARPGVTRAAGGPEVQRHGTVDQEGNGYTGEEPEQRDPARARLAHLRCERAAGLAENLAEGNEDHRPARERQGKRQEPIIAAEPQQRQRETEQRREPSGERKRECECGAFHDSPSYNRGTVHLISGTFPFTSIAPA